MNIKTLLMTTAIIMGLSLPLSATPYSQGSNSVANTAKVNGNGSNYRSKSRRHQRHFRHYFQHRYNRHLNQQGLYINKYGYQNRHRGRGRGGRHGGRGRHSHSVY